MVFIISNMRQSALNFLQTAVTIVGEQKYPVNSEDAPVNYPVIYLQGQNTV